MHPLNPPRTIPTSPRYSVVALPDKGEHHFKMPLYGAIDKATEWATARMAAVVTQPDAAVLAKWEAADPASRGEKPTGKATPAFLATHEIVSAALVGLAWCHRAMDLDTPADLDDLDTYGAAVAEELADRGYTYAEIAHLGNSVRLAMVTYFNAGMSLKSEAIAAGNA